MKRVCAAAALCALVISACPEGPFQRQSAGVVELRNYSSYPIEEIYLAPRVQSSWGPNRLSDPLPPGAGYVIPCEVWPRDWPPRREFAQIQEITVSQSAVYDLKIITAQPHPGRPNSKSTIRFEHLVTGERPLDFREAETVRVDVYGAHEDCEGGQETFAWAWVFNEANELSAAAATRLNPPYLSRDYWGATPTPPIQAPAP